MRKLLAEFILIMALPMVGNAQAPSDVQRSPAEAVPSASNPDESLREKSTGSTDEQNEAFNICLRATQRFEQQERAKGNKKPAEAPISASCKKELKSVAYWQCMDKESMQEVDFNTAHWRCAKQAK
ncbi:MAG: hypothetical protein ACXWT1_08810 [Methylobacter sp.]